MYTIKGVKMFGNEESCEFTAEVEVNIKKIYLFMNLVIIEKISLNG